MPEGSTIPVPTPSLSGTDGTQRPGSDGALTPAHMELTPVADRFAGLAESHSRGLGGDVVAGITAATIRQQAMDVRKLDGEVREEREKCKALVDELGSAKTGIAVLEERVEAGVDAVRRKAFSAAVGVALFGFAIEMLRTKVEPVGVVILVIGVAAGVYSVILPKKGK